MRSGVLRRKLDEEAVRELMGLTLPKHLQEAVRILALFYGAKESIADIVFGGTVEKGRAVTYSYAVLKQEGFSIAGIWIDPILAKLKKCGVICEKDDYAQTITITEVQKHDI